MRALPIFFVILILGYGCADAQKKLRILQFTPSLNTQIHGVGIGPSINSIKFEDDTLTTRVNGVSLECLGFGILSLFSKSHPLFLYATDNMDNVPWIEGQIAYMKKKQGYHINGLSLSLFGTAGHNISIYGVNISGLATITSRNFGISMALLRNINGVMHGLSFGALNDCIELKGVQIGVINRSLRTRGLQIGFWNENEKRSLPLMNWSFY